MAPARRILQVLYDTAVGLRSSCYQHLTVRSARTLEAQVRLDLKADAAGPHALRERMELVHAERQAPVRHWHRVPVHCSAQQ